MSLEKRLFLKGRSSSDLIDGNISYPPHEIYLCDQEIGVSEEDLERDLTNWKNLFIDNIWESSDYQLRRDSLKKLDQLYVVSRSPMVGEALKEVYDAEIYDELGVCNENVLDYITFSKQMDAAMGDPNPSLNVAAYQETEPLGSILEKVVPQALSNGEDDFDYDEFQNGLYAFNEKSTAELAVIIALTGMTLASVGYLLSIQ